MILNLNPDSIIILFSLLVGGLLNTFYIGKKMGIIETKIDTINGNVARLYEVTDDHTEKINELNKELAGMGRD